MIVSVILIVIIACIAVMAVVIGVRLGNVSRVVLMLSFHAGAQNACQQDR